MKGNENLDTYKKKFLRSNLKGAMVLKFCPATRGCQNFHVEGDRPPAKDRSLRIEGCGVNVFYGRMNMYCIFQPQIPTTTHW